MMKKTVVASSVAALFAATSAQAAGTLYQDGDTKLDHYGRIHLMLESDDGDKEIENNGSRIGFKASDQINSDLKAFARAEFRFGADERRQNEVDTTPGDESVNAVFNDLRNTYVGLGGGFGTLTFGNFDSLYYQAVSSGLDLMENTGFRAIGEAGTNARGDTVAFETADLGGAQFGFSAKHYPLTATASGDEEWNAIGYGMLTMAENMTLAVAFDQNNEDADGGEDPIIGARASYTMDPMTASLLLESSGDLTHIGVGGSFDYGMGDLYGLISMADDGNETGMDVALGANYKLSSAFRTYGELASGNDKVSGVGDTSVVTLGARYDW